MRKLLITLVATLALAATPSVAYAAFPGQNGKIAFDYHPTSDEIFVVEPDGSGRTAITGPPESERHPAWSPGGTKIVFDRNGDIVVMNADGTGQVNLTPGGVGQDSGASWSADGSQIVFSSSRSAAGVKIYKMDADDGSNVTQVTTDGFTFDGAPDWSPYGERIAFVRSGRIWTVRSDGSDLTPVTPAGLNASSPDWAPNGGRIAYTVNLNDGPPWSEIHTIEPDGTGDVDLGNAAFGTSGAGDPAWSPNGAEIAVNRGGQIWRMNADGSGTPVFVTSPSNGGPDWQPLPFPGYPRPQSASPVRVSLVPAYAQCTAPNRTHGPPLGFGSCNPPAQTSRDVTVGTPDANGAPANSVGWFRLRVHVGVPGPPDDSDVLLDGSITDVRCTSPPGPVCGGPQPGGADWTGVLSAKLGLRVTDRWNDVPTCDEPPCPQPVPATVQDFEFPVDLPCAETASASVGATCSVSTSAQALTLGSVRDGQRAIWELERVAVHSLSGDPTTLFATQGVLVP
jgi:WD40 repeat protein